MKTAVATVHGSRSAFRDWSREATSFPREIAEAALAHSAMRAKGPTDAATPWSAAN
jgi:hypothetical protein